MSDQDLKLTIKADTSDASSKLEALGSSVGKMTAAFTLGSFAVIGIEKAWGFLKGTVSDSIHAWEESEVVVAQLNAVLESTKHAAGMSADELIKLSQSLEHMTTFSDEAVLSAENLLLTFTNIGKDIFPKATETVLDMATALHEDASSAAIQLGKALQDPILGITALRRVGVNFTASQQEQIKVLVETNHTLEAQKMILKELGNEFGGSATAKAKTFQGQIEQLKNKIDDVEEGVGHGMTAALYNMMTAFGDATKGMGDNVDVGKEVFQVMAYVEQAAVNTGVGIYELAGAFAYAGSYIAESIGMLNGWNDAEMKMWSDFRESTASGMNTAKEFALNLMDANNKTAVSFGQMTADSRAFGQAGPAAFQQTMKAAEEAATKVKEANKSIADTKRKIADLTEGFLKGSTDSATAYAEAYVKQEQKVADIKMQLSKETNAQQAADLSKQLIQEQAALEGASAIKVGMSQFVTEAQRRAAETDFQRTVEDIGKKVIEDGKAYTKKLALLQQELKDNQDKRDKLSVIETQITTKAVSESKARTVSVQDEANKQIAAANQVASAWANAYSSSFFKTPSGNITAQSTPTVASKHEFGGMVPGLKGSAQLILAHGGETVIPAGGSARGGVGGAVVVNINYPTVRSDDDLSVIRSQIEEIMRPLMNNAKLAYV